MTRRTSAGTDAPTFGALPGRIVRALTDAGTKNPVMMLDEIDKVGADWRGDPRALLEVLDPAQNHTFRDHYLDVDLDLSEVLFIATANVAETIPPALLDLMEVIRIDGYTEDEKVAIARRHLLGRQIERNGLREDEVAVTDDALRAIVGDYTREAGVRNLERELGKLLRKVATSVATGDAASPVSVDANDVRPTSGGRGSSSRLPSGPSCPVSQPGWRSQRGGDVLFVEATRGRRRAERRAHPDRTARRRDEGVGADRAVLRAIPRLGASDRSHEAPRPVPSARAGRGGPEGRAERRRHDDDRPRVAVERRARSGERGMTGEVTLQGRVLPIGGVKQKVLAAHRAGLTEVILPKRNEGDLEDVPEQVREQITFYPVDDVQEVLAVALRADEPAATIDAA
jgi:ATP-dependent Lon protease